jgi:hypothetical protein
MELYRTNCVRVYLPLTSLLVMLAGSFLLSFLIKTPLLAGYWFLIAFVLIAILTILVLIVLTRNDKTTFLFLICGAILVWIGCKIYESYFIF